MHLVGLCGYPGADQEAAPLDLTKLMLDVAVRELEVAGKGQLAVVVGDFNMSPPKSLIC